VNEEPDLRPLPLPRCRGIPVGDGNCTAARMVMVTLLHLPGRAIALSVTGRGSKAPSKQPCRIQTLAIRTAAAVWNGVIRGHQADIVCNECGNVLRTVPLANVGQTLTELEITLEVATEMCPHCGSVNLFPGFAKMLAFTCR
jgi:hypothetical protein